MALGSVIGGIGAAINKKRSEPFGRVLLKGMWQGAMGGYLMFESKRLVRNFAQSGDYSYLWPSRLLNAAGNSIVENAASNKDFWTRWCFTFGFNRLEVQTENSFKLKYRVMPFALYASIYTWAQGADFDLEESIKTGAFVFVSDFIGDDDGKSIYLGVARANSITLLRGMSASEKNVLAHELIHTYQYENLFGINAFFNGIFDTLAVKNKWVRAYNRIFYTDINFPVGSGYYNFEKMIGVSYRQLTFEREAFYYDSPR